MRTSVLLFLIVLGLSLLGTSDSLASEMRIAEQVAKEARVLTGAPATLRVFVEKVRTQPGLVQIDFVAREDGAGKSTRAFARYDVTSTNGRIVRRDLTPFYRNFPHLANVRVASGTTPLPVDDSRFALQGVLRNVPGYILQAPGYLNQMRIWGESGGMVVASETRWLGNMGYQLTGIASSVRVVTVKAQVRGYDVVILHPGVALSASHSGGTIAGIDMDFSQFQPLVRDVRILVQSSGSGTDSSFPSGARGRVIVRETGQSRDVVSQNGVAEALISEIPVGWPLNFVALNLDAGYHTGNLGPVIVPEGVGSIYTDTITMN